jgi:hypothetical protein
VGPEHQQNVSVRSGSIAGALGIRDKEKFDPDHISWVAEDVNNWLGGKGTRREGAPPPSRWHVMAWVILIGEIG